MEYGERGLWRLPSQGLGSPGLGLALKQQGLCGIESGAWSDMLCSKAPKREVWGAEWGEVRDGGLAKGAGGLLDQMERRGPALLESQ